MRIKSLRVGANTEGEVGKHILEFFESKKSILLDADFTFNEYINWISLKKERDKGFIRGMPNGTDNHYNKKKIILLIDYYTSKRIWEVFNDLLIIDNITGFNFSSNLPFKVTLEDDNFFQNHWQVDRGSYSQSLIIKEDRDYCVADVHIIGMLSKPEAACFESLADEIFYPKQTANGDYESVSANGEKWNSYNSLPEIIIQKYWPFPECFHFRKINDFFQQINFYAKAFGVVERELKKANEIYDVPPRLVLTSTYL